MRSFPRCLGPSQLNALREDMISTARRCAMNETAAPGNGNTRTAHHPIPHLIAAARSGSAKAVSEQLAAGNDVNMLGEMQRTALMEAERAP